MWSLVHVAVLTAVISLLTLKLTCADGKPEKLSESESSSESCNGNVPCGSRERSATGGMTTKKVGEREAGRFDSVKSKAQRVAQAVAGRLRESIYGKVTDGKTQGGLKQKVGEVVETLHEKAYTMAGNLYQTMDPVRFYWGKAWNVTSKINLEKMSRKEQLDAIVSALTDEITQILPRSTRIDPVEVHSKGTKYICGLNGKIYDLKTIKHVKTQTETVGESVNLHISYTFEDLSFTYDTFYINIVKVIKLRGKLIIKYNKNSVTLVVTVPKMTQLLRNVIRKDCLLHIKDFKVKTMKYDDCEIEADSNFRREHSRVRIGKYLLENEDDFRRTFETQVLVELHRFLATSGDWICKDGKIAEQVQSRHGTLDDYVMSRKFRKKCLLEKKKRFLF